MISCRVRSIQWFMGKFCNEFSKIICIKIIIKINITFFSWSFYLFTINVEEMWYNLKSIQFYEGSYLLCEFTDLTPFIVISLNEIVVPNTIYTQLKSKQNINRTM